MTRRGGSRCRALKLGLAGVLGAGAALLVACGSNNSALIPATDASQLKSDIDAVATEVSNGNCGGGVTAAVAAVRSDLSSLPPTVDPRLLSALRTGVGTLSARAASECTPRTTSTRTTSTNTTPTNTNTGTTNTSTTNTNTTNTNTNTNTTDTNTTPTDTTPTDTTPTDTTPAPTDTTPAITVPGTGGGTPAPNGQTGQVAPGKSEASGGTPGGSG